MCNNLKSYLEEIYDGLRLVKFTNKQYINDIIKDLNELYKESNYNSRVRSLLDRMQFVNETTEKACLLQEDRIIKAISRFWFLKKKR